MQRYVGFLPVIVLSIAVVIGVAIGLNLSHGRTHGVADELGCGRISSSQPQPGVSKETCSFRGDRIVILTLSKGTHSLYPPNVSNNLLILRTEGQASVIGCTRRDDCVKIQRELGGHLTSVPGPMLGLSIVVD